MKKNVAALALLLMTMLMLIACSGDPGSPPATGSGSTALLKADPLRPAPMEETTLELTLLDAQGRPVTGAAVSLDLTMPAMRMPPNRPVMSEVGNGVYTAKVLFTMAGEWEIRALVKRGGASDVFTFPLSTR